MHLMTDCLATLGGRFNLILNPYDGCVYQNAYGDFRECPMDMTIGVKTPEGRLWSLPFSSRDQRFPFVEQFSTLTSIVYRGVHPSLGIELCAEFRAPFYPRNVGLCTAPFYYVDITVRSVRSFRWIKSDAPLVRGEIVFELQGDEIGFCRENAGFTYCFDSTTASRGRADSVTVPVNSWVESNDGDVLGSSGFRLGFDISDGGEARMNLLWSSWAEEPVLSVHEEKTPFKYTTLFKSREEMAAWAREERPRILKRCRYLDSLFQDWTLGVAATHLAALSLHSLLLNSWWTVRKDGSDWFSVWEGTCLYHSTIDVEYNNALLYLALWPELLEMLLDEWEYFERDGSESSGVERKGTGFLCHDMGEGCTAGQQAYPHSMEVEENANYLLLLSAWTSLTGNTKKAGTKLGLCRRLAEFIVQADTSGNGVPNLGVANTIDDASPAIQYGREQIYLALKSQAALWGLAELEQKVAPGDSEAERWRAFASKSIKTVEDKAWLGDHYAVTLDAKTDGLSDPWTGKELPAGELEGWDAYSIYTSNGLLYLFLGGGKMPRWKVHHLASDIENAARATMGCYGCRHSSGGDATIWFSQNMWRDFVGSYLGIDLLNNVERYWDYQVLTNDNWASSLYYDTTEGNNLSFYPRGATVFGMPMAAAGLRLNRVEGEVVIRPVRSTLRVPLLPLADWERMRVPWLKVYNREGVAVARVSDRDLLDDLFLTVVGAELDPD